MAIALGLWDQTHHLLLHLFHLIALGGSWLLPDGRLVHLDLCSVSPT